MGVASGYGCKQASLLFVHLKKCFFVLLYYCIRIGLTIPHGCYNILVLTISSEMTVTVWFPRAGSSVKGHRRH